MDTATLNRYYENKVKMKRNETSRNVNIVIPIVQGIMDYVNARDERFRKQPLNVGSYYSNLKVSTADEFDFSIVLDVPKLQWCTGRQRFYGFDYQNNNVVASKLALPNPPPGQVFITNISDIKQRWVSTGLESGDRCMTFEDDIVPIKVKRYFKRLVAEAVNQSKFFGVVSVSRLSDSPATKLTINDPRVGYPINIDLCPMIESKVDFKDNFGFPRYDKQWPPRDKITAIKHLGINGIAKQPFYWTLSFAVCEKELLDGIDADGGCRKKCQRIMKKLREDVWCPKGMKQELTSYHLKNALFWECEGCPSAIKWMPEMLSERVRSMTYRLLGYLQRQNLPLYFNTQVNLLETKDKVVLDAVAGRIAEFL